MALQSQNLQPPTRRDRQILSTASVEPSSGLVHHRSTLTVAELLQQAREAHQRYRDALPNRGSVGDPGVARASLAQALDFREQADVADPDHREPAWKAEAVTHDHVALLRFYREQLSR